MGHVESQISVLSSNPVTALTLFPALSAAVDLISSTSAASTFPRTTELVASIKSASNTASAMAAARNATSIAQSKDADPVINEEAGLVSGFFRLFLGF
jgi:hypothetical protein